MISYIKNLDMCEELTTFTFFGNIEKLKNLHQFVKNHYLKSSALIYKEDQKENYLVVCKIKLVRIKLRILIVLNR